MASSLQHDTAAPRGGKKRATFIAEDRAAIGKYAAENGNTAAVNVWYLRLDLPSQPP